MKKTIFTLVFYLAWVGSSFAQNNIQAMRFLTVNALMEYGQKLYDRGNYNEASAVFKHVLTFDGNQPQALRYLRNMGDAPTPSTGPALKPQESDITAQNQGKVNISDRQELKKAIENEKRVIKTLQDEIMRMRSDINVQSSVEQIY